MNKNKNTIIKDAIALFLITLVAGVALAFVYEITRGPIEARDQKAKQEAYQAVYVDAKTFEEDKDLTDAVKASETFITENGFAGAAINEVLLATDGNGGKLGYVMSLTSKEGYGGDITLSLGVSVDGAITGFKVLSNSETAGLGAKCADPEFGDQFIGINADEVVYTKSGKSADNEIDVISGATITTSAVTKAVNAGLAFIKSQAAN